MDEGKCVTDGGGRGERRGHMVDEVEYEAMKVLAKERGTRSSVLDGGSRN